MKVWTDQESGSLRGSCCPHVQLWMSCRVMWLLRMCLCLSLGMGGGYLRRPRDCVTTQCFLCFALTVFWGKAPHTQFSGLCSTLFPQRFPFSSQSCHGHCRFPSVTGFLGAGVQLCELSPSAVGGTLPALLLAVHVCLHS